MKKILDKLTELSTNKEVVNEHIVKHGSGYRLLSHKGKNLGDFPSHSAAAKHEGEVEYFKSHPKEDVEESIYTQDPQYVEPISYESQDEEMDEAKEDHQPMIFSNGEGLEAYIWPAGQRWKLDIPDMDIMEPVSSLIRAVEMLEDYGYQQADDVSEDACMDEAILPFKSEHGASQAGIPTRARWLQLCKNADPAVVFKGNKNWATATSNGKTIGEWDGIEGTLNSAGVDEDMTGGYGGGVAQATCEAGEMSPFNETSSTEKQARTMAMAAHNPTLAKKVGIPTKVAKDFNKADTGTKRLSQAMKHKPTNEDNYDDIHGIVTGQAGHKGRTLGDKIIDLLAGSGTRNAAYIIKYLRNYGLSSGQISQVRDIANQAGKTALDYIARTEKIPSKYLSDNLKSNFIVYSPFLNAGEEAINKWRALTNKIMLPKLRAQLGNGMYGESKGNNMKKTIKENADLFGNAPEALCKILRHFGKEVADFRRGEELHDDLFHALYDYYFDDMPYGTKKARDGDPFEWITDRLEKDIGEQFDPSTIDLSKMGEGAAGDAPVYEDESTHMCTYCGKEVPPGVEPSMHDCCGERGHTEPIGPELDEAESNYQRERRMSLNKSAPAMSGGNVFQKPAAANPFANDAIDRHGDLAFNQQATHVGQREAVGEDWDDEAGYDTNDYKHPDYADRAADAADFAHDQDRDERMHSSVDESFLAEENEELITQVLSDMGLDEGLDFFFDGGLVAIGTSTARVIISTLKNDPRIHGTPSISGIDGQEVQIGFNQQPKTAPSKELSVHDIPSADFNVDEMTESAVNDLKQVSSEKLKKLIKQADGERVSPVFGSQVKRMRAELAKRGEKVTEDVRLAINANGEDDVVNMIRKLSGLGASEAPTTAQSTMTDIPSLVSKMDTFSQDAEPEIEVHADAHPQPEHHGEVEEAEYVNEPNPSVHTSTTDMINRGNDLNRPKRQDYQMRPLGNNPMAEARKLMSQYEAMKNNIKTK